MNQIATLRNLSRSLRRLVGNDVYFVHSHYHCYGVALLCTDLRFCIAGELGIIYKFLRVHLMCINGQDCVRLRDISA